MPRIKARSLPAVFRPIFHARGDKLRRGENSMVGREDDGRQDPLVTTLVRHSARRKRPVGSRTRGYLCALADATNPAWV